MTVQDILERLKGVKRSGSGYVACCPAHDDRAASLSVSQGADGKVLLKCFAGCSCEQICSAIGVTIKDLFPRRENEGAGRGLNIEAVYDYYDPEGRPLIRVLRLIPKSFRRQSPDGKGGWAWGGTGDVHALYRWPQLKAACAAGQVVFLVEGEKDCDNLVRAGAVATTALGGASKWCDSYGVEFRGAAVVYIIADNDAPGRKHALAAKATLTVAGCERVRCVTLPADINGSKVKDVSDALLAGWTLDDIAQHCATAAEVGAEPERSNDKNDLPWDKPLVDCLAIAIDREHRLIEGRLPAERKRKVIIEVSLHWLREHGAFYRDIEVPTLAGAYYFSRDMRELLSVESEVFGTWLAWISGLNRATVECRALLMAVGDAAMHADYSARINPSMYWERRDDRVYLSCGDGRMARITADGVELVDNGTDNVLMRSGRTCADWKLLPEAEAVPAWDVGVVGGISSTTESASLLLSLWLLSLPLNLKNRPPLSLCGDVGSGKTRAAIGLYEILGMVPRVSSADRSEKGADDFWVSVHFGGVSTIDNVDSKCRWLPDAVASAATGGRREKRRLYTDEDLIFLSARSAIIITSANPLYATDAGLADRLINIEFERVERDTRDGALSEEVESKRDAIMSWIAWTLSKALAVGESVPYVLNRRHPDWANWCWKCGKALGLETETESALRAAERSKARISVLADTFIGAPLYRTMERYARLWEGSAEGIRSLLIANESYDDRMQQQLSAHRIGVYLRSNRVALQEVFNLSSRIVRGQTWWSITPPSANLPYKSEEISNCGGDGGDKVPFINSTELNKKIEEVKNGANIPTIPTTSTQNEDDWDPYEEWED